jgi:hypothetical protein
MKRSTLVIALGIILSVGTALAQTGDNTTSTGTPPASVPATDQANAQATSSTETANAKLATIRERAHGTPEKDAKETETKLDASKSSVDKEAAAKGDNVVAGRLATEFGTTSDALMAEKAQYNTGWGDLMIAHALQANGGDVTVDQLFQMRTTDNLGWGQIANGMGLKLGKVVSAVQSEGKVATGQSKGDGKVASMHGSSATSKGASSAHGASSTHGGSSTHGTSSTHTSGVGAGAGASGTHGHSGK